VEYALRDSSKPMGVAQYQLAALPDRLKPDLPTVDDLKQELRTMAAMELRLDAECTLRGFSARQDVNAKQPTTAKPLVRPLKKQGKAPPGAGRSSKPRKQRKLPTT
jgi:hypothetical protein